VSLRGFRFAGIHAGIKPARKDLALVVSDVPAAGAGCFTVNRAKAAPVLDAAPRLPASGVRAILVNSGNANALTGAEGRQDVVHIRRALGAQLGIPSDSIYTASTGVIGVHLPVEKITQALPRLAETLGPVCDPAAEAILTTDTHSKVTRRSVRLGGREAHVLGFAKGSGMIAPQMATMIAVICTDAAVPPPVLARALRTAIDGTFHAVVVDGDMSTNDCVFALANGLAANEPVGEAGPDYETFCAALTDVCGELARDIAADGEGATKLLTVEVSQAPDTAIARDISKAIAVSPLVKTALFGADPNWGRVLATVGARAGSQDYPIDPEKADVRIQGVRVFGDGVPQPHDPERLRARMREPEVLVEVALAAGSASATAWGCDFSYDYVKINADYTSLIVPASDGSVRRDDRLTRYSPGFKQTLLVEALKYISRFSGMKCVLAFEGEGLRKGSLRASFCEDVVLLRSVGLRPLVVHGAVPAEEGTPPLDPEMLEMVLTGRITGDLVALLNRGGGRAVGVSGKDGSLLRADPTVDESGGIPEKAGEVREVNRAFLDMLMERDYLPVIAPVGAGPGGETLHLSPEAVAAEVAVALGAEKLILLQDAPGLLAGGELRPQLTAADLEHQLADGGVSVDAKALFRAILRALEGGVQRVHVLDGRVAHTTIAELFTDHGVGTLVTRG
jgi:acetylglutamate kinase